MPDLELITRDIVIKELKSMAEKVVHMDEDFEDLIAGDVLYSVLLEISPSFISRRRLGQPGENKAAIYRYERLAPDPEELREKDWARELDAVGLEAGMPPCHYTEGYDAGYREGYAASETAKSVRNN